jgi:hypothetical protein
MMDKTGYIPEHDSSSANESISLTALLLIAIQIVAFSRRDL